MQLQMAEGLLYVKQNIFAFHVKPSCGKREEAKINVSTNKLIPDEQGLIRTENSTMSSKNRQTTITLKNNTKRRMAHIGHRMDPTIKTFNPCKETLYIWAKTFCIKTVHSRVRKQYSNNASIEFYNSVLQGVRDWHKAVLAGLEINKCKLVPPKLLLNMNNIITVQNAILET